MGVPKSIALNLTVPERVTRLNIQELQRLVENGPDVWPGAKYVVRDDGTRQDLRYAPSTSGVALNLGWTVERHMRDDDLVLFNRQPRCVRFGAKRLALRVWRFCGARAGGWV